jgi:hypothetical protein
MFDRRKIRGGLIGELFLFASDPVFRKEYIAESQRKGERNLRVGRWIFVGIPVSVWITSLLDH